MVGLSLDDLGRDWARFVVARRSIEDSPLAASDGSANRGAVGEVCDVDRCNDVAFVDFGDGAIACVAEDLLYLR